MNNSSLFTADRMTHLKIVVVSLWSAPRWSPASALPPACRDAPPPATAGWKPPCQGRQARHRVHRATAARSAEFFRFLNPQSLWRVLRRNRDSAFSGAFIRRLFVERVGGGDRPGGGPAAAVMPAARITSVARNDRRQPLRRKTARPRSGPPSSATTVIRTLEHPPAPRRGWPRLPPGRSAVPARARSAPRRQRRRRGGVRARHRERRLRAAAAGVLDSGTKVERSEHSGHPLGVGRRQTGWRGTWACGRVAGTDRLRRFRSRRSAPQRALPRRAPA